MQNSSVYQRTKIVSKGGEGKSIKTVLVPRRKSSPDPHLHHHFPIQLFIALLS